MSENVMYDAEAIINTWVKFIGETYVDRAPSPRGVSPDLRVYFNGILMYTSIGQYRSTLREIERRYPNWRYETDHRFGTTADQCFTWHARGASDDVNDSLDLQGVTILETADSEIVAARHYYEPVSHTSVFARGVTLRAV